MWDINPTTRLSWHDEHCFAAEARIVGARDSALAFDRTCFYPGGGGQPPDEATATLAGGQVLDVESVRADSNDIFFRPLNRLLTQIERILKSTRSER